MVSPETLSLIYEATKGTPEEQVRYAEALDTKTVQIFASAGVVIGLAGFSRGPLEGGWFVDALLIVAVVAYIGTAVFVYRALRIRQFHASVAPDHLWRNFWQDSPDAIRHSLIEQVADAYSNNQPILASKADLARRALVFAAIEVVAVGLAIVFSRWG